MADQGTTIKARCLDCHWETEYPPTGMHLRLWSDGRAAYEFFCVKCRVFQRIAIDREVVEVLADAGVPTTVVELPGEFLEHPGDDSAPLLTQGDLGMFLARLQQWDGPKIESTGDVTVE